MLLELINKLEFGKEQNFINFLITPIIESKRKYKGDDRTKIKGGDESEDDDEADIYKEVNQLEYNEVSEEIAISMKNQQSKDIKLLNMLEKKINNYES